MKEVNHAMFQKVSEKETVSRKNVNIKKMTITAVFSAIAFILMFYEVSVPFMPAFIKMDFSDLPAVLGTFLYGPVCGICICFIKNLFHLTVSSTCGVGEISNFILGAAFVLPTGLIYKKWNTYKGAIAGSCAGVLLMSVLSVFSNYYIVYPVYYNFMPKEVILKAYQVIFPGVHTILQALIVFNVPFTFFKGMCSVIITALIYTKIIPILKMKL